jgi:hypothetical protein
MTSLRPTPSTTLLLAVALAVSAILCAALPLQAAPLHKFREGKMRPPGVVIEFEGVETEGKELKVELSVHNNGDDYLIVDPYALRFEADSGELIFVEEDIDEGYRELDRGDVLDFPPGEDSMFELEMNTAEPIERSDHLRITFWGLSRFSLPGTAVQAPEVSFVQPAEPFEAGPFACRTKEVEVKRAKVKATFHCLYSGDQMGQIDPTKMTVRTGDGQVLQNEYRDLRLLAPGEEETVRMEVKGRFSRDDAAAQIVWQGALREAKRTQSKLEPLTLDARRMKRK